MRVLLLTQYYPPEIGAASERISSLARFLRSRCELTVLAPVPSYPWETVIEGYQQQDRDETNRGYDLLRCYKIPKSKNLFVRLFGEIVYAANCLRHALRLPRHDMVLVSSPSFFLGVVAVVLRYIIKSEFILDIRDLYPASLQQAGLLKNGPILSLLQWMEHKIYRQARLISVVNPGWMKEIKLHGGNVIALPNGVDIEAFLRESELPPAISNEQIRLLQKHFAVVYVGNLGTFYDFTPFLQAAKSFAEHGEHVFQFIFIGEGSLRSTMQKSVENDQLDNVHFWDPVPNNQLAAVLKQCSAGMVAWRSDIEFLENSVPNKVYEYLAADLDVVACLPGEIPQYLKDSGKVFKYDNAALDSILNRLRMLAAQDEVRPTPDNVLYSISRERHFKRLWRHISKLEGYLSEPVSGEQGKADLSIKHISEPVGRIHN